MRRCTKCGHFHGGNTPVCITCIDKLEKLIPMINKKLERQLKKQLNQIDRNELINNMEFRKRIDTYSTY